MNEPRFSLEKDSICYGCQYYIGGENGCNTREIPKTCIEGSLNNYEEGKANEN